MLLEKLGIYGWPNSDENLLLASLLTGDPLLLIGNHGCAKTHVAGKIAQALGRKFLAYDASKCMFEDILGYPNVSKLQQGIVEYVPSPVTVWDKEMVLVDELNRALPELQSKWLEIIRSRKIMGFDTAVKWVWAAMNPVEYAGANTMDDALIGRFALFLYPPDVLDMTETERIRVATHINGDDAPSLAEWTGGERAATVGKQDVAAVGKEMDTLLRTAARHFLRLREQLGTLPEFLARFADLLLRESHGEVRLDGRRLGFLHRNLLAMRSVEIARTERFGEALPPFPESARHVLRSSIPAGLNAEGLKREESAHKMEVCFDLLESYFDEGAELERVNLIYELFTTPDLLRKAELLLCHPLGELASSKAWTDLVAEDRDITLLAYTALQVEARRPGTVPGELLASLSGKIEGEVLSAGSVPGLQDDCIEMIGEVEELLAQETDLGKVVAVQRVTKLIASGKVNKRTVEKTKQLIELDIQAFEALLNGKPEIGVLLT